MYWNGLQNPPFCPGSLQNTFILFPRYLTTRFPKMTLQTKQIWRIEHLEIWKSKSPGSLTGAQCEVDKANKTTFGRSRCNHDPNTKTFFWEYQKTSNSSFFWLNGYLFYAFLLFFSSPPPPPPPPTPIPIPTPYYCASKDAYGRFHVRSWVLPL